MTEKQSLDHDFKHEKFYSDLRNFGEQAYKTDNILPRRYVFVLTNLCNLACDYCFQVRKKLPVEK